MTRRVNAISAQLSEGTDVFSSLEIDIHPTAGKPHKDGTITGLQAEAGATVSNGAVICEIKD